MEETVARRFHNPHAPPAVRPIGGAPFRARQARPVAPSRNDAGAGWQHGVETVSTKDVLERDPSRSGDPNWCVVGRDVSQQRLGATAGRALPLSALFRLRRVLSLGRVWGNGESQPAQGAPGFRTGCAAGQLQVGRPFLASHGMRVLSIGGQFLSMPLLLHSGGLFRNNAHHDEIDLGNHGHGDDCACPGQSHP